MFSLEIQEVFPNYFHVYKLAVSLHLISYFNECSNLFLG